MVGIERNPEIANRIANSEGVREFLRPDGAPIDLTPLCEMRPTQSGMVLLSNGDDALSMFELTCDGVFQGHIAFAQSCRGKRAIDTAREMIDFMWDQGADVIWGDVPKWNKPAILFMRRLGFQSQSSSDEDSEILEIRRTVH